MKIDDLNLTLRAYAERGLPIFRVTKLLKGYDEDILVRELTSADFRDKIGRRIDGLGGSYVIQSVEQVEVVR